MDSLNDREQLGAETLRGYLTLHRSALPNGQMRMSEGWSILWGAGGNTQVKPKKRVRGDRAKSRSRPSRVALEGQNPREQPAVGALNMRLVVRDSWKGQSPEIAARQAGPRASAWGYTDEWTVCGFIRVGNDAVTFREEKAPKGESQERCRYETRLARHRRE